MGKIKDLTGKKFGKLKVIRFEKLKNHRVEWLCECECGNKKIISSHSLLSGNTNSCGCIHKEQLVERNKKHNLSKTRLYRIWLSMKRRCYNENTKDYKYYGGRGIIVYEKWRKDFISFYEWAIENGYNEHLKKYGDLNTTIDRKNVNGNYEPSNCRWATQIEQAHNKRNSKNK